MIVTNYRPIFDHPRNLRDDIAKEIINRQCLIGLNFVRAFVNNEHPEVLYEHINHGLELGGENAVAYGDDFFLPKVILTNLEFRSITKNTKIQLRIKI